MKQIASLIGLLLPVVAAETHIEYSGEGTANIFRENSFKLIDDNGAEVVADGWGLYLPMEKGDWHIISVEKNTSIYTAGPITLDDLAESYVGVKNGIVQAQIIATVNHSLSATAYVLDYPFDLKPWLGTPVITGKRQYNNSDVWYLDIEVDYAGLHGQYIDVASDNEWTTAVILRGIKTLSSPFVYSVDIIDSCHNWVDIMASNRFGTSIVTIDCPAGFAGNGQLETDAAISSIDVYSITGVHVACLSANDRLQNLTPGTYIIVTNYQDGNRKTAKVHVTGS
ncbi:MAG: hypothetical protein Q4C34_09610 [Bacteroidales bacterium]|nr:hypothetical protein [Bacteroidales bacterium]